MEKKEVIFFQEIYIQIPDMTKNMFLYVHISLG